MTTVQPGQTASDTTPKPTAPVQETYNTTGQVEVEDDFLLFDDEKPQVPDTAQAAEPSEDADDMDMSGSEEPTETTPTEEAPTDDQPKEQEPTKSTEPKLFAEKFSTIEDLKNAYQNLGGNPARFEGKPEALEEAYMLRQSEFTRLRQEQAEQQRLAEEAAAAAAEQKAPEDIAAAVVGAIDFSTVTDAKDLVSAMVTALVQNLPKTPRPPDSQQMIQQLRETEAKQKALATIETEVPRLKTDQGFRKAFAAHVVSGKADGTPYQRSEEGLRQAMKDFISWTQSIVSDQAKAKAKSDKTKAAAQVPKQNGDGLPSSEKPDEMDEVIGAYEARSAKFGR